jgi:hypothetical protein
VQRILINYRRTDSLGHASRLYSELRDRFGEERIFMDVDSIEPGLDFTEAIKRSVRSADLMLVIIGPHWFGEAGGRRGLTDPHDYVRLELEAALEANIRILPVLVGSAEMPSSQHLPATLAMLNLRQAFELSEARWPADVNELSRRLSFMLGRPTDRLEPTVRPAQDAGSSWLRMVAEKLRLTRRG